MTVSLGVLAVAFLVVMPVELPDKTLIATLVLTTRYRPLPVLAGVSAAFFVQCLIAVTAGHLLSLLPERLVLAAVATLFAAGALILLREAWRSADDTVEPSGPSDATGAVRIAGTSFGVLFAAEWGDASQLATAALTARYEEPVSVFLGAFGALVCVATLAAVLGRVILRVAPLVWIQRAAAVIFLLLAVTAAAEAIRG